MGSMDGYVRDTGPNPWTKILETRKPDFEIMLGCGEDATGAMVIFEGPVLGRTLVVSSNIPGVTEWVIELELPEISIAPTV